MDKGPSREAARDRTVAIHYRDCNPQKPADHGHFEIYFLVGDRLTRVALQAITAASALRSSFLQPYTAASISPRAQ